VATMDDIIMAVKLLAMAANQGSRMASNSSFPGRESMLACRILAEMFRVGDIVHQDIAKSVSLAISGMSQGDLEAKLGVAQAYYTGTEVPKDEAYAMLLLEQAARDGSRRASDALNTLKKYRRHMVAIEHKVGQLRQEDDKEELRSAEELLYKFQAVQLWGSFDPKKKVHASAEAPPQTPMASPLTTNTDDCDHEGMAAPALELPTLAASEADEILFEDIEPQSAPPLPTHTDAYEVMKAPALAPSVPPPPGTAPPITAPQMTAPAPTQSPSSGALALSQENDPPRNVTQEMPAVTECVVCLDAARTHILVPCGHQCVCEDCASELSEGDACPVCRQQIVMKARVFL